MRLFHIVPFSLGTNLYQQTDWLLQCLPAWHKTAVTTPVRIFLTNDLTYTKGNTLTYKKGNTFSDFIPK